MARKAEKEDLSTWVSKSDVVRETGISERSLERRVQARKIRQGYRTIPGRRPLPVLHPDDVEQLRREMVQRTTEEQERSTALATLPVRPGGSDALTMLMSTITQSAHKEPTVFLGLKEASDYVGLSMEYLKGLVKKKKLNAIMDRGYRIRRRDLDAL